MPRRVRKWFAGGGGSSRVCVPQDRSDLSDHVKAFAQFDGLEMLSVDSLRVLGQIQEAGAQL